MHFIIIIIMLFFFMPEKYLNPSSEEKWIKCWQQKQAQTSNMSEGIVELQIL